MRGPNLLSRRSARLHPRGVLTILFDRPLDGAASSFRNRLSTVLSELSDIGHKRIDADVCIVGAGPAGISLALELARLRPDWQIVLAEGGGQGVESPYDRALYEVELGAKSYAIEASRRRMLGGTSEHWGGWCRPLDATDFVAPPGWSTPGWPFGPEALSPHLPDAHRWCEIDSDDYDLAGFRQRHPGRLFDIDDDAGFAQGLFRFSPPTRFAKRYAGELREQENLRCLLHANLTGLELRGERVVAALLRSLDGDAVRVEAGRFVLALGGIENARLLLNLRGDAAADGEGIYSPHLGRHFADHYGLRPGVVLAPADLVYRRFADDDGRSLMPVLTPAPRDLADGSMQNHCLMLEPQPAGPAPGRGYAGQSALGFADGEYWAYNVQMILEPRPHPESRIEPTDQRCELGLRRVRLEWRMYEEDVASAQALFRRIGQELGRLGLGRVRRTLHDDEELRRNFNGANHHMGTTRMANDPREGVADANARVHGCDNLYLAGSSLFPRYGHANPTLTIVALGVRLAHHLAEETA